MVTRQQATGCCYHPGGVVTPELVNRWDERIQQVARWTAYDYPDVEQEDIAQALWEKLLIQTERFQSDPEADHVTNYLRNWGKNLAWDMRISNMYASAQYFYRPKDVRKILETVFEDHEYGDGFVPKDAWSQIDRGETDAQDVRADIQATFKLLPESDQRALIARYQLGIKPGSEAKRKKLDRSVDNLTDRLNWYYRGIEYRRAKTNATSRAKIEDLEM